MPHLVLTRHQHFFCSSLLLPLPYSSLLMLGIKKSLNKPPSEPWYKIWSRHRHQICTCALYLKGFQILFQLKIPHHETYVNVKPIPQMITCYLSEFDSDEISVFSTWFGLRNFGILGLGSRNNSRTKDSGCGRNKRI